MQATRIQEQVISPSFNRETRANSLSGFHHLISTTLARNKIPSPPSFSPLNPTIEPTRPELVLIGTITKEQSTVSNLLIRHEDFGKSCWEIIHNSQNRDKPFHKIQAGTRIYLDPQTKELKWGKAADKDYAIKIDKAMPPAEQQDLSPQTAHIPLSLTPSLTKSLLHQNPSPTSFSDRLINSVQQYIGKSHDEVDCYELLVEGLKELGVKYKGNGGLGERLIQMALDKGMPRNAFLNGEGLIKASGSDLYSKTLFRVKDAQKTAQKIMRDLTPKLEKGLILSFSTPTMGHTGIISQKEDLWTFINSGKMDHPVTNALQENGVGEEHLLDEIQNWLEKARAKKEALMISMGKLNEEKLLSYAKKRKPLVRERV